MDGFLEMLISRQSIRNYNNCAIDEKDLMQIMKAAISAPSGKNGQPWKFRIITNEDEIMQIAQLSSCGRWMKKAKCFILVFLDKSISYHRIKDVQSCGAVMQNILLSAHSLGIGSCWVGEIYEKGEEVKELLGLENNSLELMGIVSLGYSDITGKKTERRVLDSFFV